MQLRLWLFTLLMLKTNFLFVPKRCMQHFGLTWWRPAARCFVCKECLCSACMQKRLRQGMRWDGLPGCLRDVSCHDWICCTVVAPVLASWQRCHGNPIEIYWGSGVHSSECFAGPGRGWPSPSHNALDFLTQKTVCSMGSLLGWSGREGFAS